MIKALIFDLDNFSPQPELEKASLLPVFDAIETNHGNLSNGLQAFLDIWHHPLDWMALEYKFSKK